MIAKDVIAKNRIRCDGSIRLREQGMRGRVAVMCNCGDLLLQAIYLIGFNLFRLRV